MDIRSLRCFVVLARELHFRRAADQLALTQPSLTQRMKVLETEIGVALFERDRRRVALTPAGAAFLEPAMAAIAAADRATSHARRAAKGDVGHLRLGFTVIAFYGSLPEAVRAFRARFPEVRVDLAEMNSPSVERALSEDAIDLGILHPPLDNPDLSSLALPPLPLVLALQENHKLAAHDLVPVGELAGEPLLIAPRAIGPNIFDRMVRFFHDNGVAVRFAQEVTPMTTMLGLVAAGVGIGFVTEGIAQAGRPGVVFRRVDPQPPALPLAVAWRGKEMSPAARRFLDIVSGDGAAGGPAG